MDPSSLEKRIQELEIEYKFLKEANKRFGPLWNISSRERHIESMYKAGLLPLVDKVNVSVIKRRSSWVTNLYYQIQRILVNLKECFPIILRILKLGVRE